MTFCCSKLLNRTFLLSSLTWLWFHTVYRLVHVASKMMLTFYFTLKH